MQERFSLPQGVKDFPPDRAERITRLQGTLLEEFERWGYRAVITPLFESLDTILLGLGSNLRDKVLKFVDPTTGDVVALRPDITPQVGRMAALELEGSADPLRICYSGRVVRFEEKGSGKEREVFQVGCELFGLAGVEADAEIMALAVKAVEKVGLRGLVLDIGHAGMLRSLLAKTGRACAMIEEALKKKDTEALVRALDGVPLPSRVRSAIEALPELYGGRDVLDAAVSLPEIGRYARQIKRVLELVDEFSLACDVNIDLAEVRGFDYYTGVTFELISPHCPVPILRGGRYDELLRNYGSSLPATGFAVDLESLIELTKDAPEGHSVHFVVIPKNRSVRREAIRLAQWLRSSGFKVVLELKPVPDVTEARMKENHKKNFYGLIFIESPKKLQLVESRSGQAKEFANLEELLKSGGV